MLWRMGYFPKRLALCDQCRHCSCMAQSRAAPVFATTHWSVVLAAADSGAPGSEAALSALCQAYWFPLYAHIRRRGHDAESARDLTQGFFAELLAHKTMAQADRNQIGRASCRERG